MSIEIEPWKARAARYSRFAVEVQRACPAMEAVTAEPGIASMLDRVCVTMEFASMDAARVALLAHAPIAKRSGDTACLDWLEMMANRRGGLLLHDGSEGGRLGLGLRPGEVNRTLRQAIATAMKTARDHG